MQPLASFLRTFSNPLKLLDSVHGIGQGTQRRPRPASLSTGACREGGKDVASIALGAGSLLPQTSTERVCTAGSKGLWKDISPATVSSPDLGVSGKLWARGAGERALRAVGARPGGVL